MDPGFVGDDSNNIHVSIMSYDQLKAQIANHPLYPNLLSASIECTKVGVAPEVASLLEEIRKENLALFRCCSQIGAEPALDRFMRSYCEVLHGYKDEVSKPFEEATRFLSGVESQLNQLCKQTLPSSATAYPYDDEQDLCCRELEATGSGESVGTRQGNAELKERLMRKYSGYLCGLRGELPKKRNARLPKDAVAALLEWWNTHYRWPYPTDDEKNKLSETTGLDQKQINNWFINQRKRHWRPTEDMRFTLMEGVSGSGGGTDAGSVYFDSAGGMGI